MSQIADVIGPTQRFQIVESPPALSVELMRILLDEKCEIEILLPTEERIVFYPNGNITATLDNVIKVWYPKPSLNDTLTHCKHNFGGVYFQFHKDGCVTSRVQADSSFYWWSPGEHNPAVVYGMTSDWKRVDDEMDELNESFKDCYYTY
jgi:hypothetical protein